jgi:hypothetical protein
MIEINLVPDVKQELIRAQRVRASVISLSILVSVVAIGAVVVLGLLLGAQAISNKLADSSISSESATLAKKPDLGNILTIQNQLTKLETLHDSKQITSRLFDILIAVNPASPNNVRVSSLKLDPSGQAMTVEGTASNNYAAVEALKKTLLSATVQYNGTNGAATVPLTQDVSIIDTSYGQDASGQKILRFTLSFTYPAELFAQSSLDARIITPTTQQNVTDSQTRVPQSLFTDATSDPGKGNQ